MAAKKKNQFKVGRLSDGGYEIALNARRWMPAHGFMGTDFLTSMCDAEFETVFPKMKLRPGQRPVKVKISIKRA